MPIINRHYCWHAIIIASITLTYITVLNTLPLNIFWMPDEGGKFIQLSSYQLSWSGGLSYQIPYLGQQLDSNHRFYPGELAYPRLFMGCNIRFGWLIWFPLFSKFLFNWFGEIGLYLIPLISGVITIAVAGLIAQKIQPKASLLTMIVIAFASPIFFYSLLVWEHTLVTALGMIALWLVVSLNETPLTWIRLLIIGLVLVWSTVIRLDMLIYTGALGLATLIAWWYHPPSHSLNLKQNWFKFGLVGLILGGSFIFFHHPDRYISGLVDEFCLVYEQDKLVNKITTGSQDVFLWHNALTRLQRLWIARTDASIPPPLGWVGFVGVLLCCNALFISKQLRLWFILTGCLGLWFVSLYVLNLDEGYRTIASLFFISPFLGLAYLYVTPLQQLKRFEVTLVGVTCFNFFVLATVALLLKGEGIKVPGLQWGLRYILIMYPLGMICATTALVYYVKTIPLTKFLQYSVVLIAFLLLAVGIGFQLRGYYEIKGTKTDLLDIYNYMATTDVPIITDLSWLYSALATEAINREFYTLYRPSGRTKELAAWLALPNNTITNFLYVSYTPPDLDWINKPATLNRYHLHKRNVKIIHGMTFTEFEIIRPN